MEYQDMISRVKQHLAVYWNCNLFDLEKANTIFVENDKQPEPFLEIAAFGEAVIISASKHLLSKVRPQLEGRSRDEIFEFPFVFGQSIYYLPDLRCFHPMPLATEFSYELFEGEKLQQLRGIEGFGNSLAFDKNGYTPTCIAFLARKDGEVIGLAGASNEDAELWEMGVDVKPAFRRRGLAAALVSHLTETIMQKDIVPFYCASVTNLGSQAAAHRSGLAPCWTTTYSNLFHGDFAYPELAKKLMVE